MKTKISIDLPTREKLIAGLAPREVHPALARAEDVAAKAEQTLEHARRELAARERLVADIPARVHRGEVKATALTEALRDRDAAALLIASAESACAEARARVSVEEKAAKLAVDREIARRCELLDRTVADLTPVLNELGELAAALAKANGPGYVSVLEWTCAPACGAIARVAK